MGVFQNMEVVRVNASCPDSSLDLDKSDIQGYASTRDRSRLVHLTGAEPDLFMVQKLPRTYLAVLHDSFAGRLNQKAVMAFCMSCHEVVCGDGTIIKLEANELTETKISGKTLSIPKETEAWVERVSEEFGFETILEIGQVAIDFAGLSKRSTPFFNCWVGTVQNR